MDRDALRWFFVTYRKLFGDQPARYSPIAFPEQPMPFPVGNAGMGGKTNPGDPSARFSVEYRTNLPRLREVQVPTLHELLAVHTQVFRAVTVDALGCLHLVAVVLFRVLQNASTHAEIFSANARQSRSSVRSMTLCCFSARLTKAHRR